MNLQVSSHLIFEPVPHFKIHGQRHSKREPEVSLGVPTK